MGGSRRAKFLEISWSFCFRPSVRWTDLGAAEFSCEIFWFSEIFLRNSWKFPNLLNAFSCDFLKRNFSKKLEELMGTLLGLIIWLKICREFAKFSRNFQIFLEKVLQNREKSTEIPPNSTIFPQKILMGSLGKAKFQWNFLYFSRSHKESTREGKKIQRGRPF